MPKIIISYRRADSDAIAGRIRDRLAAYYGDESVFMDIDNIPFGIDFRDHIRDALFENDFLVVVLGPRWLGQGKGGHFRIKEDNDPVRIEVETALERGIPVIPVLVDGATMPKPSELPDSLSAFAYRNAAEVDAGRDFHQHMDRLIRSMDQILKRKGVPTPHAPTEPLGAPPPQAHTFEPAAASPPPSASAPPPPPPPAPSPVMEAAAMLAAAPAPLQQKPAAPAPAPRIALIVALTAVATSVLSIGLVGGMMWFSGWRPGQMASNVTPPAVVNPQPAQGGSSVAVNSPPPTCSEGTPAFQDNFQKPDPGWNLTEAANTFYDKGQMVVKPDADKSTSVLYRSLLYKNATICATVQSAQATTDSTTAGGLIFWAVDYRNFYLALLYPNGSYQIYRRLDATWISVAPTAKFDAIKSGSGAVNQIAVSTVGNVATISINGRKVLDLNGQPPKNGGSFGMYGESDKDKQSEWRFLNVAVVELPANQLAVHNPSEASVSAMLSACKAGTAAAFADDFKNHDPGWNGVVSDASTFVDGHLQAHPSKNSTWRAAHWGFVYRNYTACLETKSPPAMKDMGDTAAGLIFWATDFDNYYSALVYPDGSFIINRRANGSVVNVLPKTKSASVKAGPGGENRIKVTTNGSTATVYINEVKVHEFRGQPPNNPSAVGLYAESEVGQPSEWSFLGVVVSEN